jgi:hypothetical protein
MTPANATVCPSCRKARHRGHVREFMGKRGQVSVCRCPACNGRQVKLCLIEEYTFATCETDGCWKQATHYLELSNPFDLIQGRCHKHAQQLENQIKQRGK